MSDKTKPIQSVRLEPFSYSEEAQINRFFDHIEKFGKCCVCGITVQDNKKKGWSFSMPQLVKRGHSFQMETIIFCPEHSKNHVIVSTPESRKNNILLFSKIGD